MTDTDQLPPHTITIHDHPEPHIMQWSDLELAAVKRYAEQYALQARAQVQGVDAAIRTLAYLGYTYHGGEQWKPPLGTAPRFDSPQPAQATQVEVADEFLYELWEQKYRSWIGGEQFEQIARAILALRPERAPMTGDQWTDVLGSAGPDMFDLAKQWADNKVHVYQVVNQAEKIVKAAVLRGIAAQAKKEKP